MNEAFGLVAVEAMEYGIPVVASDEGGIPDIVEDCETGHIVEKQNPEALAKALENLFRNPGERDSMGKAGRKRFEERFTEGHFENRMNECLWKCIISQDVLQKG